jgi:hypothetical protein
VHRQELNRLTVVRQIDPSPIAQAAIALDIQRLEIRLAHHRESMLKRKAGVLLSVQRAFGTVIDVHVVQICIHHPMEGGLAVDFLDRQDAVVEEPHATPDALIILGCTFHLWIGTSIGRLPILGMEVLQIPGGQPQPTTTRWPLSGLPRRERSVVRSGTLLELLTLTQEYLAFCPLLIAFFSDLHAHHVTARSWL